MTIFDGAEEVNQRLHQALRKASDRNDVNAHLLTATLLAGLSSGPTGAGGLCVPEEETYSYFLTRVLPLIAADFEPITICDPCVGSGIMLLAAARQLPAWAAQAGLVQLFGMDIDPTCVTMAQCNMMLYSLNGAGLTNALTATPQPARPPASGTW